ncbi:type IV pilus modification PilV family protein [Desulfocicer niacini]
MGSELSTIETKVLICEKKAFTLIEVLIALVILSFGILGVAQMQISAIRGNADAMKRSEILIAAQKQIEKMMQVQYDTISEGETTLGYSDDDAIPEDYMLKYVVTTVSECKKIELTMSPVTVYEYRVQPTANITFLKAKDLK